MKLIDREEVTKLTPPAAPMATRMNAALVVLMSAASANAQSGPIVLTHEAFHVAEYQSDLMKLGDVHVVDGTADLAGGTLSVCQVCLPASRAP